MHSPSEIFAQINGFFTGRSRQKSLDFSEASSDEDNESNRLFSGKFRRRSDEVFRHNDTKAQKQNGAMSSAVNLVRRAKHDLKLNFKRLSFGDNTPPALPARHFSVEKDDELPPPIPERKCSLENFLNEEFQSRFKFHPLSTCPLPARFTNCKKTYPSQTARKTRIQRPSFQPPPPPPPADTSSSPSPTSPSAKFSLALPDKSIDVFLDPPWQNHQSAQKPEKKDIISNGPQPTSLNNQTSSNDDSAQLDPDVGKNNVSPSNGSSKQEFLLKDENETEFCSIAELEKALNSSILDDEPDKNNCNGSVKILSRGQKVTKLLSTNSKSGSNPEHIPVSPCLIRPLPPPPISPSTSRHVPAPPLSPSPSRPLPPPPLQQAQKKNLLSRINSNQLPTDRAQNSGTPPLLSFAPDSPVTRRLNSLKQNSHKPKSSSSTSSPLSSRPSRPLPLKPKPLPNTSSLKNFSKTEKLNGSVSVLDKSIPSKMPLKDSPIKQPDADDIANNTPSALVPTTVSSFSPQPSLKTAFSLTPSSGLSSLFKPPVPTSSKPALKVSHQVPCQTNDNDKPPRPPPPLPSILTQEAPKIPSSSNSSPSPPLPPQPSPMPHGMTLSHSPLPPPPTPSPAPLSDPAPLPPPLKPNASNLFVPINPASATQNKKRPLPPPPSTPSFSDSVPKLPASLSTKIKCVKREDYGWGGKEIFDPREEDGDIYDVMENMESVKM